PISRVPGSRASVLRGVVGSKPFAMVVNKPVKQRSSTGADTLIGYLHDSAEYLANRGFRVSSGHFQVERQALGIAEPLRQFLREVLFPGLWVEVGHVKKTVSHRGEVTYRVSSNR